MSLALPSPADYRGACASCSSAPTTNIAALVVQQAQTARAACMGAFHEAARAIQV
jgi:hypothetical protein